MYFPHISVRIGNLLKHGRPSATQALRVRPARGNRLASGGSGHLVISSQWQCHLGKAYENDVTFSW